MGGTSLKEFVVSRALADLFDFLFCPNGPVAGLSRRVGSCGPAISPFGGLAPITGQTAKTDRPGSRITHAEHAVRLWIRPLESILGGRAHQDWVRAQSADRLSCRSTWPEDRAIPARREPERAPRREPRPETGRPELYSAVVPFLFGLRDWRECVKSRGTQRVPRGQSPPA